jgi:hypothetical protein
MIRYDGIAWHSALKASVKSLCLQASMQTSRAAKCIGQGAAAGLSNLRRRVRIGRLPWIVTTGVIALSDVEYLHNVKIVIAGQKMKRPKPGLLGQWCARSCRGRFRQIACDQWSFSNERDARHFDMIWGSGRIDPEMPGLDRSCRSSAA